MKSRGFRFQGSGLLLVCLFASTWPASAQWSPLANGTPSARGYTPIAEDTLRSRIVLFGGTPDGSTALGDTWEWTESSGPWQQVALSGPQPPARFTHATAFWSNGASGHTVIFGGEDSTGTLLGDTWIWNGSTWQSMGSTGPSARFLVAMASEPTRQRALLFGGYGSTFQGDTWAWNGAAWTQLANAGPSARAGHAMAYDSTRDRIVLFGGQDATGFVSDTWEWDGTSWSLKSSTGPGPRRDHALARKGTRIVLFGGIDPGGSDLGDTWEWDGTTWTLTASNCPPARYAHGMAPQSGAGTVLLYGGGSASTVYADTWSYSTYSITIPTGLSLIANQVDFGGNTLNELFPAGPAGATVYKWDPVACAYVVSTYNNTLHKWAPNLTLNPGEGAFFRNPGAAFTKTFSGCAHTPVLPVTLPTNCCVILSRQTNGPGTYDNIVGSAPQPGERVYTYHGGLTAYTYDDIDMVWEPSDPMVNVGEAMIICCPNCSFSPPCLPPQITTQPTNQTVEACACANFSVVANPAPLTYQWQRNGLNIPGATSSTYSLCPVALSDNGAQFQVTIANPCGSVTSVVATLTVTDTTPPVLNCPSNDIVVASTSTSGTNVSYTVTATDCDPKVTIACAPASGSLFPCGTNTVNCTASDSSGNHTNCSFRVIVQCGCMGISQETVVSNGPNQSTYSFTFQNLSGVAVKYLFLVPQNNCMTVNPDITTFKPPLAVGASATVTVTLSSSGSCTNQCFTFAALDTNVVQCCSLVHCLSSCAGKPTLTISMVGGNIVLSWPASFSCYHLQCATSVFGPYNDVTVQPTLVNGYFQVILPKNGASQFYRLHGP